MIERGAWRGLGGAVAAIALLSTPPIGQPAFAEVIRGIPLLEPGLPIALGSADVWQAASGAGGDVVVLTGVGPRADALAAALAAHGHTVLVWRGRPDGGRPDPAREARALGLLAGLVGRPAEAPTIVSDGRALPSLRAMLAVEAPPVLRAIVLDAREPIGATGESPRQPSGGLPPLALLLDPADPGPRADVSRVLLGWRAAGGDAQLVALEPGPRTLAETIDAYVRSRRPRRVPRFESMVYERDHGFERAIARHAPPAVRVVGVAAAGDRLFVALADQPARVLARDADGGWRLDAALAGEEALALARSATGHATILLTRRDRSLVVRERVGPRAEWQRRAEWPVEVEIAAGAIAEGPPGRWLVSVSRDGAARRAWWVGVDGAIAQLPLPDARVEALAADGPLTALVAMRRSMRSLRVDVAGEWRTALEWSAGPARDVIGLVPLGLGRWIALERDGASRLLDPFAGRASAEVDLVASLEAHGAAEPAPTGDGLAVAWLVHPETHDRVLWRSVPWRFDGDALMLWREGEGRHAQAMAPGLARIDVAAVAPTPAGDRAGLVIAGVDRAGRARLLEGRLPGLRPPAGWWAALDPAAGGVFVAFGDDAADLHRLDLDRDGRARWRIARAGFAGGDLVAEAPWRDPFVPGSGRAAASSAPRLRFDPETVAERCPSSGGDRSAAFLDEGEGSGLCLVHGRHPEAGEGAAPRGLWQLAHGEGTVFVGLSDAGPVTPARDAVLMLFRDARGAARWRSGVADPAGGPGVAALSEWRPRANASGESERVPVGLLRYRAEPTCGDAPIEADWRPFEAGDALPGLPRGLGARLVRADRPVCY